MARRIPSEIPFEAFAAPSRRFVPKPVYLVCGDEPLFKEEAVALIKEQVLKGADPGLCFSEYDGGELDPAAVFDELRTLPFLAKARVVVVQNAEQFMTRVPDPLTRYLEKPSSFGVLVLVTSNGRASKAVLERVRKCGVVVLCQQPSVRRLPAWIVARVRKMGKRITRDASAVLAENTGADLQQVVSHIEKLCVYVGDKQTIEAEDVEALVGPDRSRASWELGEAIRGRDTTSAVRIVRQILSRDDKAKHWLITSLASEVRKIWQTKRSIDRGADESAISSLTRIPPRYVGEFIMKVRRFSEEELEKKHELLLLADVQMKTSSTDPQIILEQLVVGLCAKEP